MLGNWILLLNRSSIGPFGVVFSGFVTSWFLASSCLAYCGGCPPNGMGAYCVCPGKSGAQACVCMNGASSCAQACGLTSLMPGSSNTLQNAVTQGIVTGLIQGLMAPEPPMTPGQIEAERQAEITRQKAEAERNQKIQNYLDSEAIKKREKEAALDREAEASLALLDPKSLPNTSTSDDELIGATSSSDPPVPGSCPGELEGMFDDLNAFAREANQEGYQFLANDVLSGTKKSLKSMGQQMQSAAWQKVGMKEYADDYRIIKSKADIVQKNSNSLKEIKNCVDTKGCDLNALAKKYNKEIGDWLKGLSTEGIQQAADRVRDASSFLQNYAQKIESNNDKIISQEAKCLAQ